MAWPQIERSLDQLSLEEQLWLLERVVRRVRENLFRAPAEHQLAAMAADPEIRGELRWIDAEFACAEADGLAMMGGL